MNRSITTADELTEADSHQGEYSLGDLLVMPSGFDYGGIAADIAMALESFARPHNLGMVMTAETGFRIAGDPERIMVPNVAFVRAERIPLGGVKGVFQGPPDLAVEILSPGDHEAEVSTKVADWLQAGCRLVWVVDPDSHAVAFHDNRGKAMILTDSDLLVGGDVLPDFHLLIEELFV
jgi:Uma2 family endonuclease